MECMGLLTIKSRLDLKFKLQNKHEEWLKKYQSS